VEVYTVNMLPPELVRYINEFVVPSRISWRAEHHLKVLTDQLLYVKFPNILHNYVDDDGDRYSIRDIWELKIYTPYSTIHKQSPDMEKFKRICCHVWWRQRSDYIEQYRKSVYQRAWSPYTSTYVLGRHIQCTLPERAYTRLLRMESMRMIGLMSGEWSGCIPLDEYRAECIVNWSIY